MSDVLFVQAESPVDSSRTVVPGILSQANVQLVPAATFGVVDEVRELFERLRSCAGWWRGPDLQRATPKLMGITMAFHLSRA